VELPAGAVALDAPKDAEAMELLVDRRAAQRTPSARAAAEKPTVEVTVRIDDVFMRESDLEPMSLTPFLDVAERHGATVIVAVIPNRLNQSPNENGAMAAELRAAIARGHEVTQHGFDHSCPQCGDTGHEFTCRETGEALDAERMQEMIAEGKRLIEEAIDRRVYVYGGVGTDRYSPEMYASLEKLGFPGVTGTPVAEHARHGLTCVPTGSDYTWALKSEEELAAALARMKRDFAAAVPEDASTGYFQLNFHDHFIRTGWEDGITLRFLDEALTWLLTEQDLAEVRLIDSRDKLGLREADLALTGRE
jgi:hypothetical protein